MAEINENVDLEKENTVLFADSTKVDKVNVTPHQLSFNDYVKSWSEKGEGTKEASQDIISMLSRPGLVANFEWAETDENDKLLRVVDIPEMIMSSKFKAAKLKYFKYFRSDFRLRVVINATRFHAGRLLIVWAPGTKLSSISGRNELDIASLLCFPSIIVDPATNQSTEFTIPFISPFLYYPNITYGDATADLCQLLTQNMGVVKVFVLNKLSSGQATTTPVSISIYGWFDKPVVSVPIYAEMGVVSDVIDGLVSPMTEIVTTATDAASGASRMLRTVGLSKPDNIGANMRVTPVVANSLAYGVGCDTIEKLTIDPKANLEPCNELFGTKDDEMDIVYIGKTWALLARAEWTTTAKSGDKIWSADLFPPQTTTAGWMIRAFKYWCGNVRVRIQIVANQFVTGRVMAVYIPSGVDLPETAILSDYSDQMYNQVYDLTGTSESEFTIPFNAPYPVLPTPAFAKSDTSDYCGIDHYSIGTIRLVVVNPLRTTKSTAEKVYINVYMSFDDDLEVYWPTLVGIHGSVFASNVSWDQMVFTAAEADADAKNQFPTPAAQAFTQSGVLFQESTSEQDRESEFEMFLDAENLELVAQSGRLMAEGEKEEVKIANKKTKGKSDGPKPVVQSSRISTKPNPLWVSRREAGFAAKYNFGERVTNLRQVIKRYSVAYHMKGELLTATSVPTDSSATSVLPTVTFALGAAPFADATIASSAVSIKTSEAQRVISCWTFLSYFGCIYRFQRGGVRMKFLMGTQPNMSVIAAPGYPPSIGAQDNVKNNPFIRAPTVLNYPLFPVSVGAGVDRNKYAINAFYARKLMSFVSDGAIAASCDINPNLEMEIPYYSPWMMIPTPAGVVSNAKLDPPVTNPPTPAAGTATKATLAALKMNRTITLYFLLGKIGLQATVPTVTSTIYYNPAVPNITMFQAAADDFQFGFLTGPPVLITQVVANPQ